MNDLQKTGGVALEIIKRGSDTACRLIESLLGEPFDVAGGLMADQLSAWRWRNRVRIAERAAKLMEQRKISAQIIPPDFLLPLIEKSGDVSDPDLSEMWSNLLASGVESEVNQHPSFIHVLAELSAIDARVMELIGRQYHQGSFEFSRYKELDKLGIAKDQYDLAISNLLRLGLISDDFRFLSHFGYLFSRACSRSYPNNWVLDVEGGQTLSDQQERLAEEIKRIEHEQKILSYTQHLAR